MTFLELDSKPESYMETMSNSERKTEANSAFKSFDRFCKAKYNDRTMEQVFEELRALENTSKFKSYLFGMMNNYISYLNESLTPFTVRGYFRHLKKYLKHTGIQFTNEELKENVKLPSIIEAEHHALELDEMKKIFDCVPPKHKALYFVLSSSGIRIKEAVQLRKRDFDLSQDRIKIIIPGKYTKTKKSRITFVSSEGRDWLEPRLKRLKTDDLVFGTSEKPLHARQSEEERFDRIRKNAGFCSCEKKNRRGNDCTGKLESGHHKITIHSFRSWFITKTNRIDFGFGHALAGHGLYMGRYDRLTDSEKLELYIKTEPTLQIFKREETNSKDLERMKDKINSVYDFLKPLMKSKDDMITFNEDELHKIIRSLQDIK